MEPQEQHDSVASAPESDTTTSNTSTTASADELAAETSNKTRNTIIAVGIVGLMLLGVVYVMEKQGRIDSNIFGGVSDVFRSEATVATVNGEKITQSELDVSVSQLTQAAAAQGVDVTLPDARDDINDQALQVLVNTEVLVQAAAERAISVTDEDVSARIAEIETEVGGAEVLAERMVELGIDQTQLRRDVESEMIIDQLLDELFAEANVEVTEAEVTQIYEAAVASGAEVPALEEVRDQIELQIKTSKEQEVVDTYIEEQKAEATIELMT